MPRGTEPAESSTSNLRDSFGLARPVISGVVPLVDEGTYEAKGSIGEDVLVEADIFADGHDAVAAELRYRRDGQTRWQSTSLAPLGNDRFRGSFPVAEIGRHLFNIRAVIDHYESWRQALELRAAAGVDLDVDVLVGVELIEAAAARAKGDERRQLGDFARALRARDSDHRSVEIANDADLRELMARHRDLRSATTSPNYPVHVERARARFSSWYEMFPRSAARDEARSGTFADVETRLEYVARLGFDVIYLPPIHPIGTTARKGRNGENSAGPSDPGSPWAIGAPSGGHTAIHPDLGTLSDFEHLVRAADSVGIEVAIDIAFQCSPDHPWVKEHPEWFRHLPDGSIKTAENPPKRYEDVFPLDFATSDWRNLWEALLGVVEFWIDHGVTVFRVDNPHTKPLVFWEWLMKAMRRRHPDVIMLAEAFTRPRIMEHLGKIGFSQSYTYFTWRTSSYELRDYLTDLTRTRTADFFRPNLWPNTPDILHEVLQRGGRPAFALRFVLAATLAASYGIYGPAFELLEHLPRSEGSEEYLNSEKFEIRHWNIDSDVSLAGLIARLNTIRRDHPALQQNRTLTFHGADNDQLLVYSKTTEPTEALPHRDIILTVVNLDPFAAHASIVHLDLDALGIRHDEPFAVRDLLTGSRYRWRGPDNFVRLDPEALPAHIFHVELSVDGPQ